MRFSFPFGVEGGMWDVIVLISDPCLSNYLVLRSFLYTKSFSGHIVFEMISE